jgi:hypothetical protein
LRTGVRVGTLDLTPRGAPARGAGGDAVRGSARGAALREAARNVVRRIVAIVLRSIVDSSARPSSTASRP